MRSSRRCRRGTAVERLRRPPITAISEAGETRTPFAVTHIGGLVANLVRHHELLRHLMIRNLRAQYKQSVLGYAWIFFNPIAQLGIMSFIFTTAVHTRSQGSTAFPLFLFIGLLPWIFFSNAVSAATESIANGSNLNTAVYFPRELVVLAAVLVRMVDLLAGALILAVLMVATSQPLGWTAAWLPFLLMLHVLFIVGLALPVAALNLFFRDVRYLVSTALHLWFFMTPIFYSVSSIPSKYSFIYDLNPNARLIQAYRWALLTGVGPPVTSVIWAGGLAVLSLLVGYYLFKKLEPYFADYI